MDSFLDFSNKVILISGASSDIGVEVASSLHDLGAILILHASKEESIEQLKNKFEAYNRHYFFLCDFSIPESIEAVYNDQGLNSIRIDGFLNCVGMRSRRPINLIKPDHVKDVLNINFVSFIELIRLVTKKNAFNPGLSILSISSISAQSGGAGVTIYAASKAAGDAAIRCLAKELNSKNIRINSLVCGQVNTKAYKELMDSKSDNIDKVLERQFMGLAQPQSVADMVLFMLSDRSRFLNGISLPFDGGYLI